LLRLNDEQVCRVRIHSLHDSRVSLDAERDRDGWTTADCVTERVPVYGIQSIDEAAVPHRISYIVDCDLCSTQTRFTIHIHVGLILFNRHTRVQGQLSCSGLCNHQTNPSLTQSNQIAARFASLATHTTGLIGNKWKSTNHSCWQRIL